MAFVAAAATRFVPAIVPYRRILDLVALVMVVAVLVYAVLASPIAEASQQVHQAQTQFGGLMGGSFGGGMSGGFGRNPASMQSPVSFSVLPHIGVVPFLLAPVFLFLARRRERLMALPV